MDVGAERVPSLAEAAAWCEGREQPVRGVCSQPAFQRVVIIKTCENSLSNLKDLNGMKVDEFHVDFTPI